MLTSEIRDILAKVKYLDWTFDVKGEMGSPEVPDYLQVCFPAQCSQTGMWEGWKGRKWTLSRHMTKSEIVNTAFKAVMTAIEHEAREAFTFKGYAIFGPHLDVETLVKIHANGNPTEVRSEVDRTMMTY